MDKLKIFGTGLSGMIGSRFTEMFAADFEFINLDLATGVDITKIDQVEEVLGKNPGTIVIHLAAFTDVSKAYAETDNRLGSTYQVNVLGTRNIAQASKKFNHYLIHISTDFVFNGQKNSAYIETDQPSPIEWYGQTKTWAEEEVIQSGAKSVIVRTAFPFRAKFNFKFDIVRKIIGQLKSNTLPSMFTDQLITPTFIDDLCQVFKIFMEKQPNGIYHVVGSTSLSPYELVEKVSTIIGPKREILKSSFKEFLKTDPRPRQQYLKISNAKLFQDFGYKMKSIDEALQVLKSQL